MKKLAVNKHNDIYREANGNVAIANGLEALKQTLEHVMQSLLGEAMYAKDRGLPYEQCIWNGNPNLRLFEAYARTAILREAGVKNVVSIAVSVKDSVLHYTAVINTIYGEVALYG